MRTLRILIVAPILILYSLSMADSIDLSSQRENEITEGFPSVDSLGNNLICFKFVRTMVFDLRVFMKNSNNTEQLSTEIIINDLLVSIYLPPMECFSFMPGSIGYSVLIDDARQHVHRRFSIFERDPFMDYFGQVERSEYLSRNNKLRLKAGK